MNLIPYEKLDDFQKEAIEVLKRGHNLILSAPTGTGKTAVIDHIATLYLSEGKKIFYTSPLKALCNQKFRDFRALFGKERAGLITGDEVVNEGADILVMTTEILRNKLQEDSLEEIPNLVVFDEIHYISDRERGATWEEAIVLLSPDTQIAGLSATCPNAEELALWIEGLKGVKTEVIVHNKRAVPLELYGFSKRRKLIPFKKAVRSARSSHIPYKMPYHTEIIEMLDDLDMLPALYFLFNRKKVEEFAYELSRRKSFTDKIERDEIKRILKNEDIDEEVKPFFKRIYPLLLKGIGFHHAGLLPQIKRIVETLFEKRLLKVVYCTSTFALGVNMPARTVCLDSVHKFDGERIRPLKNLEFFQKAGRAGRRGIDEKGFVIVRFDERDFDAIPVYDESKVEPIESSFRLSYNSIVNFLRRESFEDLLNFLSSSFWSFQKERTKKDAIEEIKKLKSELEKLPHFECVYNNELYQERKSQLSHKIDLLTRKLESIRETLMKPDISEKKRRRLKVKERNLERDIEKKKNELIQLRLEMCEFCENRNRCMKTKRKKEILEKRIERLQEWLKHISVHLKKELEGKIKVLEELKYINGNREILVGGKILSRIHIDELVVTELILEGFLQELDPETLVALFTCIGRGGDKGGTKPKTLPKKLKRDVNDIVSFILDVESRYIDIPETQGVNWNFWEAGRLWAKGESVKAIVDRLGMYEGDLISSLKQCKDLLSQLKRAYELELGRGPLNEYNKIREAISLVDRPFLKEFGEE